MSRVPRLVLLAAVLAPGAAWAGGTLKVDSDTAGQAVLIDGQDLGLVTPALVPALRAGPHRVRVEGDCRVGEGLAIVRDGESVEINVDTKAIPATLTLSASPDGAKLFLDGEEVGAGDRSVSCGTHSVRATHPGHLAAVVSVELAAGESMELPLRLTPVGSAILTVDVDVEDSFVLFDGDVIGEGGVYEKEVTAGPHQLRVEADGFKPWEENLLLADGQDLQLEVSLKRGKGRGLAAARPPNAAKPSRPAKPAREPKPAKEKVARAPRERKPVDVMAVSGWSLTAAGAGLGVLAGVQLARMGQYGRTYVDMTETYRTTPAGEEPTAGTIDAYREDTLLPQRNRAVTSTVLATALLAGGVTLVVAF